MYAEVIFFRYVAATTGHRSFQRAAAALNITQPTLSGLFRELEERLGMLLFARSTGGAYLTANGEDILVVVKRVLADMDNLQN